MEQKSKILYLYKLLKETTDEEHWSNPKKTLEKIISYFENSSDGTIIVSDFVNYVIDWLLEESIITNTSIYNERNIRNVYGKRSFCGRLKYIKNRAISI